MAELILRDPELPQLATQPPARLERHPVTVYLGSLAPASRRTMAGALANLALMLTGQDDPLSLAWQELRFQHVSLLRSKLAEQFAPATANRHLAALRGVLRAARKLRLLEPTDYQEALDEARVVKGERVPRGRSLSTGEIQALMNICAADQSAAGLRDAALVGLLYGCGLRRAEAVGLDLTHFNLTDGSLRVLGKGNKERTLYVQGGAMDALLDWLELRGDRPGPLFVRIRRGGHIQWARLTAQAVLHILLERARQAGVTHFSPHDLRRTLAGDLLDAGEDIAIVSKILGHADVSTTLRYDRRPEAAKKKAQSKIHVPYQRRPMIRPGKN